MKRYAIEMETICDGWVNTWTVIDENGKAEPETFESYSEAETALNEFLAEIEDQIATGQRDPDNGYSREEFCIVEINTRTEGENA